ncbi:MAG TPA: diguanylate cyclase [Burkholderiaceae bacterium]|nr:diguanylate cyclase [Burkholderiaceae bacterium]
MRCRLDFFPWALAGNLCAALIALVVATAAGAADDPVVELDPQAARVVLNDALLLYVDTTGQLDIDDVTRPEMANRFVRPAGDPRNLGHIYSVVWIKFTVRAAPGDAAARVLELAYPFADYVTLYVPKPEGGFRMSIGGDHSRVSDREIPDRLFLFPAAPTPGGDTTYFLRYQNLGLLSLPLSIWRDDALRYSRDREMLLLGGYYGCLFALLLFNLALFAGLRARVYLAYVVYTAAMIYFMATQNGLANLYIYPELPAVADKSNYLSVLLAATSIMLFGRMYLGIGTASPRIDRWLVPLQWLGVALTVTLPFLPRLLVFWTTMFYGIIVISAVYTVALYHWLAVHSRPAAYVSVAITLPVVGAAFLFLRNFGYFPVNWVTEHGLQIGTMFEMLVLSLGLAEQIAVIRREREEARRAAAEDTLTGLANRAQLDARLPQILAHARRAGHRVGVLWIDLDDLKPINDRHGHAAGDALLRRVGERMREVVRGGDFVARVGGDEFVVVAEARDNDDDFSALAARLNDGIATPIEHGLVQLRASASIGVAVFPDHAQSEAELLQRADRAMYEAKAAGRNTYRLAA